MWLLDGMTLLLYNHEARNMNILNLMWLLDGMTLLCNHEVETEHPQHHVAFRWYDASS